MKEIKKLKFQEPHKFKRKAHEYEYKFNLKLIARTFDSAESAAEKSDLKECETCSLNGKTYSSCWEVWIRLEYGQEIQTRWSSRLSFGGRKTHLQCWETRPCSYVFSKDEVFRNSCDQKIFSAPRVGFVFKFPIPNSVLLARCFQFWILPRCPIIGTCFACEKTGHWCACCPAMTKRLVSQIQSG